MCLFGGSTPPVVQQTPIKDAAEAEAEAAAKSAQDRTARNRRIRASSLIQTSGQGDLSGTGNAPSGKTQLGA